MSPPDWSWEDSYAAPTLVAMPHTLPLSHAFNGTEYHQFSNYPSCCRQAVPSSPAPLPVDPPQAPNSHQTMSQSTRQSATTADFRAKSPKQTIPPATTAGRKRCCHEISSDTETAEETSATTPRAAPIYGPGMTVIYPDDPDTSVVDAASQSGTWVEDRLFHPTPSSLGGAVVARPQLEPRKSRRLTETRETGEWMDVD